MLEFLRYLDQSRTNFVAQSEAYRLDRIETPVDGRRVWAMRIGALRKREQGRGISVAAWASAPRNSIESLSQNGTYWWKIQGTINTNLGKAITEESQSNG